MSGIHETHPTLGIIGAGAMGSGIAQVSAAARIETRLFDSRGGAAENSIAEIARRLRRRVAEGKQDSTDAEMTISRLVAVSSIEAMAECDVVVEAVVEDLQIKRTLFGQLEDIVGPDTILASNTSSLPIGAIAAGLRNRGRFAGLHFFNPVPLMKLVEVVPGPETTQEVVETLVSLGGRLGRDPVVVRDMPGFLVNLGGRAYTTEALAILHENVASVADIDAIMRDCCRFRMGPFELMDLTRMDVNFPVTRFIHESFFGDPRLRSTPYHRYMVETGQLGRKTKRGFYDYSEGATRPVPDAPNGSAPATKIVAAEASAQLVQLLSEAGVTIVEEDDGVSPIVAAPLGEDATAFAVRAGVDPHRLVAVDLAFDISRRVVVMTAPGADLTVRQAVIDALIGTGRAVTVIADSPGFVAQRIVAMVANLGCEMAQMGLASTRDIDKAMRLGLNYPMGPLEFADTVGPRNVLKILGELQALTGDDRYRPSQWLRRRAALDIPIWTV